MSLVEQSDLKLEITVNPNNRLIRFYRKFWDKTGPITFCRLFWATVASPFVAVGITVCAPIWAPLAGAAKLRHKSLNRRIAKQQVDKPPKPKPEVEKKETRRIKFLDWLGRGASKSLLAFQSWIDDHKAGLHRTADVIVIIILGVIAGCLLVLIGSTLYVIGTSLLTASAFFWHVMMIIAISLISAIVAFGTLFISGRFAHRKRYDYALGYIVSRPAIGAWALFKLGYRAVKTNTCPRITITD